MIYRRVRGCCVCESQYAHQIDKDLLNRIPFQEIVDTRHHLFVDPALPLTLMGMESHWNHMKQAIDVVASLVMEQAEDLVPKTLSPVGRPHSNSGQEVFKEFVRRRIDEIQVMEDLIVSGLEDLQSMTPKNAMERQGEINDDKDLRNRVRKDTATITLDSARVKQLTAQMAREQEYVERGRLVLRMFDLFRNAIESVPESIRGTISTQLKMGLSRDIELRELLILQRPKQEDVQDAEIISIEKLPVVADTRGQ